jgi:hypothetical protein
MGEQRNIRCRRRDVRARRLTGILARFLPVWWLLIMRRRGPHG